MSLPLILIDSETKAAGLQAQLAGICDILPVPGFPAAASWLPPRDKLKRGTPKFSFAPSSSAARFWGQISKLLERDIYLAFENNLQGEHLSWLVSGCLARLGQGGKTPGRLRLSGYNREELHRAFRLVDIVQEEPAICHHLRSMLNSCLGKHLERLLGTRQGPGELPLDFCSLAILALVRESEIEAAAILPPSRWQVRLLLRVGQDTIAARLHYAYEVSDDGYFPEPAEAKKAIELFQDQDVLVKSIRRHETVLQPPLPFTWPELMAEAFLRHGIVPLRAARALDELYRGEAVNGSREGLISAPWSLEPVSLAPLVEKICRFHASSGTDRPGGSQTCQAGALLPLDPEFAPESLPEGLAPEVGILYHLILARALAWQSAPAVIEVVEIELAAGNSCLFNATLRRALTPGFLAYHQGIRDQDLLGPSPLDHLKEGQKLDTARIVPESTRGEAPEPYTLAGLVGDLRGFGLEADPTVRNYLGRMFEHGYLSLLAEGRLRLGENGARTVAILERALPSLPKLQLPVLMEQLCQEMVSGRKPIDFGMQQFEQTLIMQGKILVRAETVAPVRRRASTPGSIIKADGRGDGPLEQGQSPVAPESAPGPPPDGLPGSRIESVNASEGGPGAGAASSISAAEARRSGTEMTEPANESSPTPAQESERLPPPPEAAAVREGTMVCPFCQDGDILVKRDRTGRTIYVCPREGCDFLSWSPPRVQECPACGNGYLLEEPGPGGGAILACPRQECGFREGLAGKDRQEDAVAASGQARVRRVVRRAGATTGGRRRVVVVRRKKT